MGREPPKTSTPHNLPYSGAAEFIGRDTDLENLHRQLQADKPVVISAISGMGGIGKTELALRYAYQHLNSTYRGGIAWIKSRENIGSLIIDFVRQKTDLDPPSDWELAAQVQWCWAKWQDATTLIVFDNVQNYGDVRAFLPPPKSQFRVLLTSRDKFPAPVQKYEIKVLEPEYALLLLGSFDESVRDRINEDTPSAATICKWLGYLPLGLELVGRYLAKKPDLALAKMWERLQAQRLTAQALKETDATMTATLGVIAAFELSWQELTSAAQQVAARLSLFAPAEMPWWLVEACLSDLETEQLEDLRDEELLKSSLLTRTGEGMYELHSLLHEFFALKLQAMAEREEFTRKFAQVLTICAINIPQKITLQDSNQIIAFIPHLITVNNFFDYLEVADRISSCLGLCRFYKFLGQFSVAEFWHLISLDIAENNLGLKHLETATVLNNLAGTYYAMAKYQEAIIIYNKALSIREELLGIDHHDTAQVMDNLGLAHSYIRNYDEALSLHEKALNIYEQRLGADHFDTIICLNNLAELYRKINNYSQAELLCKIAIDRQQKSGNLVDVSIVNNLALTYKSIGRYDEAEELYIYSLRIREEIFGSGHIDTAISLNNLAQLYVKMSKYTEAEVFYLKSLDICEKTLGYEHMFACGVLDNLSRFYFSTECYAKAEPLLIKLLSIYEHSSEIDSFAIAQYQKC